MNKTNLQVPLAILASVFLSSCNKAPEAATTPPPRSSAEDPAAIQQRIDDAVQKATADATARVEQQAQERAAAEGRQRAETQKAAEARALEANQQAIKTHLTKLGVVTKKMQNFKPGDAAAARQFMRDSYDAAVAIPTFDCPEDYRQAYQKLLGNFEQVVKVLNTVPSDIVGQLSEAVKDGESGNVGGSERSRQEGVDTATRHLQDSLQEMGAIARRYGVK